MKDIPGYEGTYKINECGNIINKNGHLMRTAVSNSGYIRTALENPVTGERKNKSIHRLVAETFIPNPDNLPVVMHIDNDPFNNCVSNLRWGTQSDNIQQAFIEGRKKSPGINRKPNAYQLYNENTNDSIIIMGRSNVSDKIGYSEISLKNMVGNDREIALGPYKGYKIKNLKSKAYKEVIKVVR